MSEAGGRCSGKLRRALPCCAPTAEGSKTESVGRPWTRRSARERVSKRRYENHQCIRRVCPGLPRSRRARRRRGHLVRAGRKPNPCARPPRTSEAARGKVRVIWLARAGSYGMNDAGRLRRRCAVLARRQAPVRVQYIARRNRVDQRDRRLGRMRAGTSTEACLAGLRGLRLFRACAQQRTTSRRTLAGQLMRTSEEHDWRSFRGVVRFTTRAR